jgi:putative hydrolase
MDTGTPTAVNGGWNSFVAEKLRETAALLAQQEANPFRVSAYRRAADTVAALDRDVAAIFQEQGEEGLEALPHIGRSLAAAIAEMVRTGRWAQLDRLRGTLDPVKAFQTVPGIGPELARRIHDHLHIDTLEALELAAHDRSLERVPGLGPRRAAIVRHALAAMLARRRPGLARAQPVRPEVGTILDVDAEYRRKAEADSLPKIAPRRFNPTGTAWLPILHTRRGDWEFTALFSNTPLAHELGRTRDWVVIYFHTDNDPEGQCTAVTETRGILEGRRVVRGREEECRRFHETA